MGNKTKSVRLLHNVTAMNNAELLTFFIHGGSGVTAAPDLAQRLLQRFGGLRQLLHADADQIAAEKGIGDARLAILQALPVLAQRYFEESLPAGRAIRSPADTEAFLIAKMLRKAK